MGKINQRAMEDIKIPGIVGSIVLGTFVGMGMIAPAGLKLFGPIGDNPRSWNALGAFIGIAILVWCHFQHKKEKKQKCQKNNRKWMISSRYITIHGRSPW